MNNEDKIDLTPSPRVLRMLGQIEFKPWQCLAELIDNSVDAFLASRGSGGGLFPQVNVEVSAVTDIRAGNGRITVSDNGPGMSADRLRDAVRAGFSGNNSIDKLGLFGMGFNVATARLGNRTEVWTTTTESEVWTGVRIDFDEMEHAGSFRAPALTRRKTATESSAHGTIVEISKLEQERAQYLRSGQGGRATRAKLSRVYNKIMRDIGLKVIVCAMPLEAREFCVWGKERFVETKSADIGRVPAILDIDQDLGERLYCEECWTWLMDEEAVCPVCQQSAHLKRRSRRIQGWLGIQRYFDPVDYGVDLIRNGRVIEERSKIFFTWVDPESGEEVAEYPLEQTHWGGRIVGELSIDFVPLASHQKDSFDKQTPEWRLVQRAVHGDGPLLPDLRKQMGLSPRAESPLARLHSAYRRGSPPGLRHLVPGDSSGRGINQEPKGWAERFYAGEAEYLADDVWWKAVLLAEEKRKQGGSAVPEDLAGGGIAAALAGAKKSRGAALTDAAVDERGLPQVPMDADADPTLSGTYEVPEIPGSPRLVVDAQRVVRGMQRGGQHIAFTVLGGRAEFVYWPEHEWFVESLLEPVDCLIEELAYQLLARSSVSQREWPLSRITRALRERYFRWSLNSFGEVRSGAEAFLRDLGVHLDENLSGLAPLDEDVLPATAREALAREVARAERAGAERVAEVTRNGRFVRYLGATILPHCLEQWPDLVFDGRFLSVEYRSVAPDLRGEVLRQVSTAVNDLLWVVDPGATARGGDEWRVRLSRSATSVRMLDAWRA